MKRILLLISCFLIVTLAYGQDTIQCQRIPNKCISREYFFEKEKDTVIIYDTKDEANDLVNRLQQDYGNICEVGSLQSIDYSKFSLAQCTINLDGTIEKSCEIEASLVLNSDSTEALMLIRVYSGSFTLRNINGAKLLVKIPKLPVTVKSFKRQVNYITRKVTPSAKKSKGARYD